MHETWSGLTPLQLAAKLGDHRMCKHILRKRLVLNWCWGPLSSYRISLDEIDSAHEGGNDVLELVGDFRAQESTQSLVLDDFMLGFLFALIKEKWLLWTWIAFYTLRLLELTYLALVGAATPDCVAPACYVRLSHPPVTLACYTRLCGTRLLHPPVASDALSSSSSPTSPTPCPAQVITLSFLLKFEPGTRSHVLAVFILVLSLALVAIECYEITLWWRNDEIRTFMSYAAFRAKMRGLSLWMNAFSTKVTARG